MLILELRVPGSGEAVGPAEAGLKLVGQVPEEDPS